MLEENETERERREEWIVTRKAILKSKINYLKRGALRTLMALNLNILKNNFHLQRKIRFKLF